MTTLIETRPAPPTKEERWLAQLDRFQAFEIEHGRRPRVHARDDYERTLGLWFREQLQNAQRNKLRGERRRVLDDRVPGWFVPHGVNRRKAAARVRQLKDYRDAYGKWPSARAKDPATLELAQWLGGQRSGQGTAATREQLDAQVPGWNETVQETWERTAQEIATFRARTGEMPSASSRDERVKAWGRWIGDMRRGRGMTPERTAHLDEVLPGWRIGGLPGTRPAQLESAKVHEAWWAGQLRRYKAFTEEHGRLPRCRASSKDERSLALWLQGQRNRAAGRRGQMTDEHRRILNETLPGWNASSTAAG